MLFSEPIMKICYRRPIVYKVASFVAAQLGIYNFDYEFECYKTMITRKEMQELQESVEEMSPNELAQYLFHDK